MYTYECITRDLIKKVKAHSVYAEGIIITDLQWNDVQYIYFPLIDIQSKWSKKIVKKIVIAMLSTFFKYIGIKFVSFINKKKNLHHYKQ